METGPTGGPSTWTTTPAYDNLTRSPNAIWSDGGLDGEKAGTILLFSGIFLGLVGSMFTMLGWLDYESSMSLEWTKLLGPIMLSVGGAFLFISVCRFGTFSRRLWGMTGEEEEEAGEVAGGRGASEFGRPPPTTGGHSFVFNGVQHPITFHCATVVPRHIPPPYDSLAQQQQHPIGDARASDAALGLHRAGLPVPYFYPVCPGENPAFTTEDGFPLGRSHALTSQTRNRVHGPDGQQGEKDEGDSSTCPLPPPAYEDIYRPASPR